MELPKRLTNEGEIRRDDGDWKVAFDFSVPRDAIQETIISKSLSRIINT